MGVLVWGMVGIALWHFTVFLPDRFWGGIVGAFVGATLGAVFVGLALHGFDALGPDDLSITTAFEGVPGALLGMAAVYFEGARRERRDEALGLH